MAERLELPSMNQFAETGFIIKVYRSFQEMRKAKEENNNQHRKMLE
jgi:hypothetical protein